MTFQYLADGTTSVSFSAMAPWLNWAVVTAAQSVFSEAVGVKSLLYTNPNRIGPGDPMYSSNEQTFAHDCSGARIVDLLHTSKYLTQPNSTGLASLYHNFVQSVGGNFDGYFQDGADNVTQTSALPCNYSVSGWTADANALDTNSSLAPRVLYNDLMYGSYNNGSYTPPPAMGMNPTALGGMHEGCYSAADNSNPKPALNNWAATEDTELAMARAGKFFVCRGLNTTNAVNADDLRTFMVASFLMTYDLGTSMLSEKFAVPSNFEVGAEAELVALDPVVATPSDISGLQVSNHIYAREYQHCYIDGNFAGPCAAVVNNDHSGYAHPFPFPGKYKHTLALIGGGVLDGGTIGSLGPAPPANVAGDDAVIAFQ